MFQVFGGNFLFGLAWYGRISWLPLAFQLRDTFLIVWYSVVLYCDSVWFYSLQLIILFNNYWQFGFVLVFAGITALWQRRCQLFWSDVTEESRTLAGFTDVGKEQADTVPRDGRERTDLRVVPQGSTGAALRHSICCKDYWVSSQESGLCLYCESVV